MKNDFTTAPLAPGLTGAGGSTVEKSFYASHTEILTLPDKPVLVQTFVAQASVERFDIGILIWFARLDLP